MLWLATTSNARDRWMQREQRKVKIEIMLFVVVVVARRQTVGKNVYNISSHSDPHQDSVTISSWNSVEDVKRHHWETTSWPAGSERDLRHPSLASLSLFSFFFFLNFFEKRWPLPTQSSGFNLDTDVYSVHTFTLCLASALVLLFACHVKCEK